MRMDTCHFKGGLGKGVECVIVFPGVAGLTSFFLMMDMEVKTSDVVAAGVL